MTPTAQRSQPAPLAVTLLAGGVGGARMAEGLAACPGTDLTVIGNIADDAAFHGLWVSPDIDTLTYTLAGLIDRNQGWGVADEGHRALDMLERLGNPVWMSLGDRDLGVHIYRSQRRAQGDRPQHIATDIARALGVGQRIVLPSDDVVQTRVLTDAGWIGFQDYFVRQRCAPRIRRIAFDGIDSARPTPEALEAIANADLIVIAPSNPLVSIAPILGIAGIAAAIAGAAAPVIAVSPFIAGKVVKGPADRMMTDLGLRADAVGVARQYRDLADALVIDRLDAHLTPLIEAEGPAAIPDDILMPDLAAKARLAGGIIALGQRLAAQRGAA
ncbi:2-phospho-L-lactate transferase [Paracoccus jiaweipingae]|uniref:2-phospho-L-lactate transferase n=1 Tax=unclassified Paracoccus (in: a-proteobacteria) TaxID=2688777 RepID=UPI003796AB24